jgi:glycerol-3-phosphate dehydrogenase (NAD(P)+)
MNDILVVGGGSWGTAFAHYLAGLGGRVRIWVREPDVRHAMLERRENPVFLPGVELHPGLTPVAELAAEGQRADTLVFAVPSKFLRAVFTQLRPVAGHASLVNLSKGFESGSLLTMSQVAADVFGADVGRRWVTLSGPSFARELAAGHPTAIVAAAAQTALLEEVQRRFSSPILRIYRSDDLPGVEVGGSVKNVMAIASGAANGLGLGYNTTASLVTRAVQEMSRLGVALGARPETFWGLAGIGDLMLTCFGPLSRNFQLGRQIALGQSLEEAVGATPMVAEGVETTRAVHTLAERRGIVMPIVAEVHRMLFAGKPPRAALYDLMTRSLKAEWNTNWNTM